MRTPSAKTKKETDMAKTVVATIQERAVLVTTEHRGVFFGYAATHTEGPILKLKRARLCVYWSQAMKGFMGLASMGPDRGCRIGPPADIELRAITAVVEVTPEAVKRWEDAPWQ